MAASGITVCFRTTSKCSDILLSPSSVTFIESWIVKGGRDVEKVISEYLSGIELGTTQTRKNLSVVPLFNKLDGEPLYHTVSILSSKK
ncbi:MAG: hypothetical protein A4E65_02613 [Syntrophorhabdus sp. PtaU1.Bin153]|nr:MAG: hypothetical protein A4E65_02613 [Syntrophorhabdus sp. PtaU1.Bin153]